MMLEHELEEAMDLQRTRLSQRDQYVDLAKYHERHSEIAEALEAERIAGECLVEVLQLAQKVCEHWVERAKDAWAERDAAQDELAAVKAALPKWRMDTSWFAQQQQRNLVGEWGTCSVFYNSYKTGTGMPPWECRLPSKLKPIQPSWTMEAAMLAVTEALGLPPCEVEE